MTRAQSPGDGETFDDQDVADPDDSEQDAGDLADEMSEESFPSSDPPATWRGGDDA